jgi:superfamily II DNA or RNA helicase
VPLSKAELVLPLDGDDDEEETAPEEALVFFADNIGRLELENEGDLPWIQLLRKEKEILFPKEEIEEALIEFLELPCLPRLVTPEEFELSREETPPRPRLVLEPEDTPEWMNPQLVADVSFRYGDVEVKASDERPAVVDFDDGLFLRRDMEWERNKLVRLLEVGMKPAAGQEDGLELDPRQLPAVAEPLLLEGWDVVTKGVSMRPPSPPALRVKSGVDWFELSGEVDFEGDPVDFSKILDAISRGERTVELDDGSQGLLPTEWIDTYDSLAQLAQSSSEDGLRFLPSQALLVDALMVAMPPVDVDQTFSELREKLRTFESIKPKKEPRGFQGTLRGYQRMGLGWLCFLREFGLGGILADDMGLGKTVQALALLRTYRTPSKSSGRPSLVVAPRSLVYNWIDETERFTPTLKVVEYGGPDREELHGKLDEYDLVVTTYGTLRRDIGFLATVPFDTVILDEAQAIKNPESQTAKASRLLDAEHRLALTGTPIENHLGELGSIFEFLNPGLLGRLPALDVLASGREASERELKLVAQGIRPFILRRTKGQVLADLPEKTEQVLICSLAPEQRELYDKLRLAYRESLLEQVEEKGVGGSTMQVLEALLRLRQVACHPGLVDDDWEKAGSAKLETLSEQVNEVMAEGHKAVVFSQFTSLLAYVREHLDEEEVEYAYLDGQTRDRGAVVERFQTDPDCNLFLVSLKAGGVGLNLTAASYVFLLDPWWNPAVEAQAIDRAHRIGQKQPVFAYRLIAKDTVEERMLELQRSKRKLADAILDGEGGDAVSELTADDLRMLLS